VTISAETERVPYWSKNEIIVSNIFHYTDKNGWNAIRSQVVWRFQANQPKDPGRPFGAYFTDIEPSQANLRTLHKRLRVPKMKQEYVFWFLETVGLEQLNGGRGRDRRIFFSRTDYDVIQERQKYDGTTDAVMEDFK
jgi:hypothetical protein